MDEEIKRYAKSKLNIPLDLFMFAVCQIQKTTRVKNQAESIFPDIPLAPNDKLR